MGVSLEGLFRREVAPALLKRNAFDKKKDEVGEAITAFTQTTGNLLNRGSVIVLNASAKSISEKLFSQTTDKGFLSPIYYETLKLKSSRKFFSSRQLASGIDWIARIFQTPPTNSIVVFQGKPNGIHRNVARCTQRLFGMHGQLLAQSFAAGIMRACF